MFDHKLIKQHFGRAAGQYDTYARLQQDVLAEAMQLAMGYWGQGMRIADIGSGTGLLGAEAAARGLRWEVTGSDLAYGMCHYAAGRGQLSVNADAHRLPFADAVFDGVFSSLMLQWANAPADVFCEMIRVLKPGGYAIVTTFTKGSMEQLQQAFAAMGTLKRTSQFSTMHEWVASTSTAGFAVKKIQEKNHVEHYPDTMAMMRALRAIGASHKEGGTTRRPLTRRQLRELEDIYRSRFADSQGLPLNWKILTLVLHKE